MSKVLSQKEAVYTATKSVLAECSIHFEDGQNVADSLTTEIRKSINAIICEGFKSGSISLESNESNQKKLQSDSALRSYVSGLMGNWYRKDTRLNGNTKHQPKNPGSRAGQTDPQIKNLTLLKKQYQASGQPTSEIDSFIAKRVAELKAAKVKTVEPDLSVIPAELKKALGL